MKQIAEIGFSCGRYYLKVAGIILAMEGDPYRGMEIPEEFLDPIPEDELEHARIGDEKASDLSIEIIRFFRGDRWTKKMFTYVAEQINKAAE